MKKILLIVLTAGIALLLFAGEELNYSSPDNWFICEAEKPNAAYDVFYLYPTLSNEKERIFLDFNDKAAMKKALGFAKAQNGILGSDARVFAPKVRQLEYHAILHCSENASDRQGHRQFMIGVQDAANAFLFYRRNFQNGRPFILFGHSQGAMELYELLKNDRGIAGENGFVAAYLIGLPKTTAAQIQEDFKGREIAPAQSADDLAVIIVWNTQSPEAENPLFSVQNGYCINPLNWKTDATPASSQENKGAFFYDYRTGKSKEVPHFCGATVNPDKGVLMVNLPSNSQWDAHGVMGRGVFHMNDIWFFAGNLKENILHRVELWQMQKGREK